MKKLIALGLELTGFMAIAFLLGRFVDEYFSLKGYGTLGLVLVMYSLWFFRLYKIFR